MSLIIIIGLPFPGWYLIRVSRSLEAVAGTANEQNIDLGFLKVGGTANTTLLFSDINFIRWLVWRKYGSLNFPTVLNEALDNARKDYVRMGGLFILIIIAGFSIGLLGR